MLIDSKGTVTLENKAATSTKTFSLKVGHVDRSLCSQTDPSHSTNASSTWTTATMLPWYDRFRQPEVATDGVGQLVLRFWVAEGRSFLQQDNIRNLQAPDAYDVNSILPFFATFLYFKYSISLPDLSAYYCKLFLGSSPIVLIIRPCTITCRIRRIWEACRSPSSMRKCRLL